MSPWLVAFVTCAVLDWIAVARHLRPLEYVCKPATLAVLIVWAALGPAPSPWMLAALAFSLLGDVLLMLPGDRFAAGLAAFLVGHVAYLAAFDTPLGRWLAWTAVIVVATGWVSVPVLAAVRSSRLRPAIVVYGLALAGMTASAIASGDRIAAAGGLLFLASDSLLAWGRFVRPLPGGRVAVHVTYHLGQLALASYLRAATVPR